jgi:hypothetical protein
MNVSARLDGAVPHCTVAAAANARRPWRLQGKGKNGTTFRSSLPDTRFEIPGTRIAAPQAQNLLSDK